MRLHPFALVLAPMLSWPVQAMPPDPEAFERAVQSLRPAAQALGLELRTDGLEMAQWRTGLPLAARASADVCRIGYLPWLATYRFGWLFPDLPAPQRALWLEGLVAHELAHCVQPSAAEEAADLAFAAHVVGRSAADGPALVERLAQLRERHAGRDPAHDSSTALRAWAACRAAAAECPP